MNGEMLRHDVQREVILKQNIFEYLHTVELRVHPPVPAAELIFIKMCRFPAATMMPSGLMVRGVLSRLDKKFKVKVPPSDQDFYWKANDVMQWDTLNEVEMRLLKILAKHLHDLQRLFGQGGDAFHTKLTEFLDEQEAEKAIGWKPQHWSLRHIQVMMAKAVCRAIAEGRELWLSCLHIPRRWTPWLGIFIPDDSFDNSRVVSFAFTARETDNELTDGGAKLLRKNAWINSLEVRFEPATEQIIPKRWMNGLHFYNNKEHQRNLVVPWPQWMQQLGALSNQTT